MILGPGRVGAWRWCVALASGRPRGKGDKVRGRVIENRFSDDRLPAYPGIMPDHNRLHYP